MAKGKNSFVAYTGWGETFSCLPDEKAGQLVKILFQYVTDNDPEIVDPLLKIAFISIKQDLKRDLKKWEQYIDKQKINGQKGGRPKETQKTQAFSEKPKKAEDVDVDDNDIKEKKESKKRFAPPSVEMVYDYFLEKLPMGQARREADKFIAYYESNGWKVGKNKMQKWKAAASGWLNRLPDFEKEKSSGQKEKVNAAKIAKEKIYAASKTQ